MKSDFSKKIFNVLEVVVIVTVCVFCLFAVLQKTVFKENGIFGYRSYVIVSDSMNPELKIGDVILVKKTELADIKVGDVLTYEGMVSDYAGKIITHRVKSIAIEDGEYIFYCQGVNNTLSDPAVYQSQIVGVMSHKFILLSFLSRMVRNGIGFWVCICIPLIILFFVEINNMGKEIKEDVNIGKKEKEKRIKREEKLKEIEEKKTKLLESINSNVDEIEIPKKVSVKKKKVEEVIEQPVEETKETEVKVDRNIKTLDSYDEDYLENNEIVYNEEKSVFEEFKSDNKKNLSKDAKETEDIFKLKDSDDDVISEDELLESTSSIVVPIRVSDGLTKKKASIKTNYEVTNLKRKARGIDAVEIDITGEVSSNMYDGYDITGDIEDDLEKTKEYNFAGLKDMDLPKKNTKNSSKEKSIKK